MLCNWEHYTHALVALAPKKTVIIVFEEKSIWPLIMDGSYTPDPTSAAANIAPEVNSASDIFIISQCCSMHPHGEVHALCTGPKDPGRETSSIIAIRKRRFQNSWGEHIISGKGVVHSEVRDQPKRAGPRAIPAPA